MTKLKEIIEEDKRKNKAISEVVIDWKHFDHLLPQLLNPEAKNFPEFEDAINDFSDICNSLISGITEIKNMVTEFKQDK
jgi:hypothetical protein